MIIPTKIAAYSDMNMYIGRVIKHYSKNTHRSIKIYCLGCTIDTHRPLLTVYVVSGIKA